MGSRANRPANSHLSKITFSKDYYSRINAQPSLNFVLYLLYNGSLTKANRWHLICIKKVARLYVHHFCSSDCFKLTMGRRFPLQSEARNKMEQVIESTPDWQEGRALPLSYTRKI